VSEALKRLGFETIVGLDLDDVGIKERSIDFDDAWENTLFGSAYHADGVTSSERPKYGALELVRYQDGPIPRFGSCYLELRQGPVERTSQLTIPKLLHMLLELAQSRKDPAIRKAGRVLDTEIEAQVQINLRCDVELLIETRHLQRAPQGRFRASSPADTSYRCAGTADFGSRRPTCPTIFADRRCRVSRGVLRAESLIHRGQIYRRCSSRTQHLLFELLCNLAEAEKSDPSRLKQAREARTTSRKCRWTDSSNPSTNLGRIFLVHVKEMGHRGPHSRFALVIRNHRHDAAEYLERAAVPVFDDIVMGGKAGVDERAQILSNRLSSMQSATPKLQIASVAKQSNALPKVLSSISFHIASSHSGGAVLVKVVISVSCVLW
jgi:Protein of unknown function (DUF3626)